jgi:hypothetical protein
MSVRALRVLSQSALTNIVSAKYSDDFSTSIELNEEPLVEVLHSS